MQPRLSALQVFSVFNRGSCERWLWAVVLGGWFALMGWSLPGSVSAAGASEGRGQVVLLTSALSAPGHAADTQFPLDRPRREVSLPDNWWASRPGAQGPLWYRLNFDAPVSAASLFSIYVERVCDSAELFLNGQLVLGSGAPRDKGARDCHRPQLVTLPAGLLRPLGNVLDVKVRGQALANVSARQRSGGLSGIRIGDPDLLAQAHAERTFWSVALVGTVTTATSLVGLLALWFGWVNRREPRLIYLGLLILTWNLLSARILARQLPFDPYTIELMVNFGFAVATALGIQYLLGQARLRSRAVEAGLVVQAVLVPASLAWAGPEQTFLGANAWRLLMEFEVIAVMATCLYQLRQSRLPRFGATAFGLGGLAVLLLVDRAGQLPFVFPVQMHAVHFLLPIVLSVLGARQLQAFAQALQAVEITRNSLETRVSEAAEEMERNYAQMAELRVEQVTEKERKRIAGDLHDDLGAKLLTIVHTSESERISTLAREALEEMRLSVKGLTGKPLPVGDALADWRAETVLRLGQAGVEADWRSPTEDLTQQLSARAFVQTTRILREAISNVIKHSGASHCKVRCSLGEHDFVLVVQDNGKGIPMELDGKLDRGHGMASMKHRAKQMQGQCLVESGPGYGTVIRLTLPL